MTGHANSQHNVPRATLTEEVTASPDSCAIAHCHGLGTRTGMSCPAPVAGERFELSGSGAYRPALPGRHVCPRLAIRPGKFLRRPAGSFIHLQDVLRLSALD